MRVCFLTKASCFHILSYQSIFWHSKWPFRSQVQASFYLFYLFLIWSAWGVLSMEEVCWSKFHIVKGVVLSVVGSEIKKMGLSGVSGYFCFYILLVLSVLGLAISEFLPYAGGYKLVLHLLLVISLSCYYSYEVSSWIGNLSWSLGSLMPSGLSPFFGPVAVVVEYFSQVVRPFALALRMTLHGLSSIALMECMKYVFFMLASWIASVSVESCSVFINLGSALNLKSEYWNFLWNPRVVWLGLSDNFFYLIAAWALLWVELAEFILMVVQIGVFVGLFLFFTSEHPQKHWVVVKEETSV